MSDPKFPSIDTVHETLSDLTKLFEDRNALLDSMFRDDKYKDFLLAENIQSLVEADKRDDAAGGKIKKDLANGYEVLKAKTNMQKFASFISPGMLPTLDLSEEGDYDDDDVDEEIEEREETENTEQPAPEKGEKGDKGDPGDTNINVEAPKGNFNNRLTTNSTTQNSGLKLAEGGAVSPSPMMNALNPSAQRPETKSGVKSLESLGLVGKKNVASELTEDLGLEEYKKALADAMALPLKAVAAGLAGLMDKVEVPGGEGAALEAQTSSVAKAFDVKTKKKKKDKQSGGFGVGSMLKMLLPFGMGASRPKGKSKFSKQNYDQGRLSLKDFEAMGKNDPNWDAKQEYENYMNDFGTDQKRFEEGDPTLNAFGGPSLAPDQISTQGDTKIDAMRNSISNITQGAKNMFMNSKAVTQVKAASGFITKLLGKVQPASEGSQYEKQDINNITNQVRMSNESNMAQKTTMMINDEKTEGGRAAAARLKEIVAQMQQGAGTNTPTNTIAPTEIRVSKYLNHSLTTVHGGETPHDV
tara:strand:+ start:2164 stop:3744 length:1581 start_codon:yes stop_codon:yes gene_type:complete